jgi:hypothetical protein
MLLRWIKDFRKKRCTTRITVGLTAALCAVCVSPRAYAELQPQATQGQVDAQPAGDPTTWAIAAAKNEVRILQQQGFFSVRYRERKIDSKGDTTREIIESKQGGVARLIERDGKPITAAEDAAERGRLNDALTHPDDFIRHHHRDDSMRNNIIQVIQIMPKAMINTYTPGQPQPPGATSRQVVLDYAPDPKFHPPTMFAEVLTGFQGRVWIDPLTQTMTRIEGKVLHPVNFGFGILARIYPGGTLEFEQTNAGANHWVYSNVDEHLIVRALMVKTMPENVKMTSSNIEMLPSLMSYQDAIHMLLAEQIPLR